MKRITSFIAMVLLLVLSISLFNGCDNKENNYKSDNYERALMMSEGIVNADLIPSEDVSLERKPMGLQTVQDDFDTVFEALKAQDFAQNIIGDNWSGAIFAIKACAALMVYADQNNIDFLNENIFCKFENDESQCYVDFDFIDDSVVVYVWEDYKNEYNDVVLARVQYSYIDENNYCISGTSLDATDWKTFTYYDKGNDYIYFDQGQDYFSLQMLKEESGENYEVHYVESDENNLATVINEYVNNLNEYINANYANYNLTEMKSNSKTIDRSFTSFLYEFMDE